MWALADLSSQIPERFHHLLIDKLELSGAVCVYLTTSEADYLRGRTVFASWDLQQLLQRKDEIIENDLFKMKLTF